MTTTGNKEKKLLLAVNPCAGQKRIQSKLSDIIGIFNRAGYKVYTYITEKSGDICQILCEDYNDIDLVVCAGGDGTFNETVAGVLSSKRDIPIGYIPAGSTNDFAASIELSTDFDQAARNIVPVNTEKMDIGLFDKRYFSYVASFGAFTRTSYTTPQELKNVLGHAAYILSGVQEISQLKPYHLKFELEDGTVMEDNYIFGAISNSTSLGGIVKLDRNIVNLQDGKMELILIREPESLIELTECIHSIRTHTYDSPMITFTNFKSIKINAPEDMDWTLDGEMEPGHENIEVKCLHNAINICK